MSTISRRSALLTMMSIFGVFTGRAEADTFENDAKKYSTFSGLNGAFLNKTTINMDVDGFEEYRFKFGGQTLVLTPEEMWAALQPEKNK